MPLTLDEYYTRMGKGQYPCELDAEAPVSPSGARLYVQCASRGEAIETPQNR